MASLKDFVDLGQAIWLDYIRRSFIESGELKELIESGLRGVTSNPSIFEKAIVGSKDYDAQIEPMVSEDKSTGHIYEALVVKDIRAAADLLAPVYESTNKADGFVSLEVNPELAHHTEKTLAEARRLFDAVGRPNTMIKVPATPEGIPAIRQLIGEGININVTLIFSVKQYEEVARAYIEGLQKLAEDGHDLSRVASVASFFVSRVDTAVDELLEKAGNQELQGKIAVANSKVARMRFNEIFAGPEWQALAAQGARVQRLLWASTSAKNPAYSDLHYVEPLIGSDTVNTVPPDTLAAILDHAIALPTLASDTEQAQEQLKALADAGIELDEITEHLLADGVGKFAKSFRQLMEGIEQKRHKLLQARQSVRTWLSSYETPVRKGLEELRDDNVLKRIRDHDHTVWKPDPDEIANRLGWLTLPERMKELVGEIVDFREELKSDGINRALVLGMGGSSLSPELFARTFPCTPGGMELDILDSTDPQLVLAQEKSFPPEKSLYIVSTKSGTTVETLSAFKYLYNKTVEQLGEEKAGEHFAAITDPGSTLAAMAEDLGFRKVFLNDPNVGGRFSVLSYFGLVPAGLVGVDLERLLDRAMVAESNCESCNSPVEGNNYGALLGVFIGELARHGADKLTFVISQEIEAFGDWVEQLIAESLGKEGKGVVPVIRESVQIPGDYADDRTFVHLRMKGDRSRDEKVRDLADAGKPVIRFDLNDRYDLGYHFFLWEMGTAVAGRFMGINPFDQPNVELAKKMARNMLSEYLDKGELPHEEPAIQGNGVSVYTDVEAAGPEWALPAFLSQAPPNGYVAIQAYLYPRGENMMALTALRIALRINTGLAVTLGFGPRFLHSTGQLHKGDGGQGLFIQITADDAVDVPIPDEPGSDEASVTFGVLKRAQAMGDRQALIDSGRKVIRIHFHDKPADGIYRLLETIR